MRLNVGVIFGGKSVEHEISIISAVEAMGIWMKINISYSNYMIKIILVYRKSFKTLSNYRDIKLVKRYARELHIVKKW